MKRSWIVLAVVLLIASNGWAISDGPGGRIYLTRYSYTVNPADEVQIMRVDVDAQWNIVQDCGSIASLTNQYSLDTTNYTVSLHPEVLHPRANPDGSPASGDGSVFVPTYYDNSVHTRFWKVMPDGTVSTIHPGIGTPDYTTRGELLTQAITPMVIDQTGQASGMAGSYMGLANTYGRGVWYDGDSNDSLEDAADTFYYTSGTASNYDAEIGATPAQDPSILDSHWAMTYSRINYIQYLGIGTDPLGNPNSPTWSGTNTFHQYSDWTLGSGYRCYWQSGTFAVGDTNSDNNVDVYVLTSARAGYDNPVTGIWLLSDLDGSGKIDTTDDRCQLIYDASTLSEAWDDPGTGDIELIRDPDSGKWFLLMMYAGGQSVDGRLVVLGLADNGLSVVDAKEIATLLDTGGTSTSGTRYGFKGVEFDADPMSGVIPEPGTLLLLGTGILGAVGMLRRRRMS